MQSCGMTLSMNSTASFTPAGVEDVTLDPVPPHNYDKATPAYQRPHVNPTQSQHTLVDLDTQQVVQMGSGQIPEYCDIQPTPVTTVYRTSSNSSVVFSSAAPSCLPSQVLDSNSLSMLNSSSLQTGDSLSLVQFEHNYCQAMNERERSDEEPPCASSCSSSGSSSSSSSSDSDDSSDETSNRPEVSTLPISADFFGDIDLSLYDFDLFCPITTPGFKVASGGTEELVRSFPSGSGPSADNRTSNASPSCGKNELLSEELDHIMQVLIGS